MNELETLQISSWSRQSLGGDDYVGKRGHKLHGASRQSEDGTKRAERLCRSRPLGDKSHTKRVITHRTPKLGRRAANQILVLAVNTSRDVERQVKAHVRKRRSAMTWRGEQDLQASFVRHTVIWRTSERVVSQSALSLDSHMSAQQALNDLCSADDQSCTVQPQNRAWVSVYTSSPEKTDSAVTDYFWKSKREDQSCHDSSVNCHVRLQVR